MIIREATERDIPEILLVLKASLGEISSQKTEAVWRYKHIENPFGKSLILVAIENHEIIGVRALMQWKWQLGGDEFNSLRAVDTATHPEHQGKGVFKKLTLRAIEIAKEQGFNFIFNTPNSQSFPGYIKMGWEEINKLKIRVVPINPFRWLGDKIVPSYHVSYKSSSIQKKELIEKYNYLKKQSDDLFTLKSSEYLFWRYENNPMQQYEVFGDEDFYLAAYIKGHKYFKELRITEHIYVDQIGLNKVKQALKSLVNKYGAQLITSSVELQSGIGISGNFGPILTLKELNLSTSLKSDLGQIGNWSYTLGDLELY